MRGSCCFIVLEHADDAGHHKAEDEEEHAYTDDRHECRVREGGGHPAAEPDLFVEKIRKPVKGYLEGSARLAGGDHVDIQLREDLRVVLERIGQRRALAHAVAHRRSAARRPVFSSCSTSTDSASMSGSPDERSVASWRVAFATSPSFTRLPKVKVAVPRRPALAEAPSRISRTMMPSFLSFALTVFRPSPS